MIKPGVSQVFLTSSQWAALNPVVPAHVVAVSIDIGGQKIGDGIKTWSQLRYSGEGSIATITVQSNRLPVDNEILVMCAAENKWIFRLVGCHLTQTECTGAALTVYPKHSIIVETNDSTHIGTGRVKIADGVTNFSNLPWIGTSDEFTAHLSNLNNPHQVTKSQIGLANVDNVQQIPLSQKGANSGVCPLDTAGKVSSTYLPSYVDDVLEYPTLASFPTTGEGGIIYIALNTNATYRWSGTQYINIGTTDAPIDGKTYGRKNGAWTQVDSTGNIDCGNASSTYGGVSPINCGGAT